RVGRGEYRVVVRVDELEPNELHALKGRQVGDVVARVGVVAGARQEGHPAGEGETVKAGACENVDQPGGFLGVRPEAVAALLVSVPHVDPGDVGHRAQVVSDEGRLVVGR